MLGFYRMIKSFQIVYYWGGRIKWLRSALDPNIPCPVNGSWAQGQTPTLCPTNGSWVPHQTPTLPTLWMAPVDHKITFTAKVTHPWKEDFTCFIPHNPYKNSACESHCCPLTDDMSKAKEKTSIDKSRDLLTCQSTVWDAATCHALRLFLSSGQPRKINLLAPTLPSPLFIVPSHCCPQCEHHSKARLEARSWGDPHFASSYPISFVSSCSDFPPYADSPQDKDKVLNLCPQILVWCFHCLPHQNRK